jgi:hypothetical protein
MSLLVLEVTSACQVPVIPLTFRYENTGPSDFSHAIRVTAPLTGKTRVVFPVLHDEIPQRIVFAGVDLHTAALRCIDRVGYITDETSLDVPLVLNISPSWREGVLYQRLPVIDDVLPSWR